MTTTLDPATAGGTTTGASPLHKMQGLRQQMRHALIERDEEIDAVLLAILSREHACFVGPAGTAKTMLVNHLAAGIHDAVKFNILLTKFTLPDEVFGPIDVQAYKTGVHARISNLCLPEAHFAFFDEVFKASPAILNSCLTSMEERKWKNRGHWHAMPLLSLFGASNEWPVHGDSQSELGALFDRFLFRLPVKPVSMAGTDRLLFGTLPAVHPCITLDDIRDAQVQTEALGWTQEAKDSLRLVIEECRSQSVVPGDRRKRKSVIACQANAWLNGHAQVETDDLECLRHLLWEDPKEDIAKVNGIVAKCANPDMAKLQQYQAEIEQLFSLETTIKKEPGTEFFSTLKKLRTIKQDLIKLETTSTGNIKERVTTTLKDLEPRLADMISL